MSSATVPISCDRPASAPRPASGHRLLQRLALMYGIALSYLLLAPQPLFFLGSQGETLDAAVTRTVADWMEHAAVYLVFTGLVLVAWSGQRSPRRLLILLLAHATLTELLQHWIPDREASVTDLLANGCGILVGALVTGLILVLRPVPASSPGPADVSAL